MPVAANIYLYSYESKYIDKLTKYDKEEKAQAFHLFLFVWLMMSLYIVSRHLLLE